jgi:hypothetical protein
VPFYVPFYVPWFADAAKCLELQSADIPERRSDVGL